LTSLKISSGLTPTTSAVYPRIVREIRSMLERVIWQGYPIQSFALSS
jgi:hypothetical protein